METQQQVQQDDKKQAPRRKWPPRGLWITAVVVMTLILVSIITTIWIFSTYHPDTSTQITIMSVLAAIVLGLPGLMFAYFQWFYPRPSDEHRPSATHSSSSQLPPIIIQVPPHPPVSSQSTSADVAGKSQPTIPKITIQSQQLVTTNAPSVPGPKTLRSDSIFPFNVKLPKPGEFYGRVREREALINRTYNIGV